jgi:proline iminopeptidase
MQATSSFVDRIRHSAFGTYAAYLAHGLRHPALLRSQTADSLRDEVLAGDSLVRAPDWVTDFTTEIDADTADVWPWLVQMGYGRGGFYGWYRYDNGGVASADMIVRELQHLHVGDVIPDGPAAADGFGVWRVVDLEPERSLVLFSRRHPWTGLEIVAGGPEPFVECSWVFVLTPLAAGRSRLHVRVRATYHASTSSRWLAKVARVFLGLGDSVMENTMLLGIRSRAEALHAEREREREHGDWPWFD